MSRSFAVTVCVATLCVLSLSALAQPVITDGRDRWISAEGAAAGEGPAAQEEARNAALRKAVEQACGVFISSHTEDRDYQAVYDRVFASAVGYVREYKNDRYSVAGGVTKCTLTARVSTQKFEQDWATIAHTVAREGNPRIIVAIQENPAADQSSEMKYEGVVQSKLEEFLLEKGLQLMDREQSSQVVKRDLALANAKDDMAAVAALGAKFKADVVIVGTAEAKYAGTVTIGAATMYKYNATINVRAVQSDSAALLASKSFPVTLTTADKFSGGEKSLAKAAGEAAPKLLTTVVEAWRKRAQVSRVVQLRISPIDYAACRNLEAEMTRIKGVRSFNIREITEGVATIDVECEQTTKGLADLMSQVKTVPLSVTEFNANRVMCTVIPAATAAPVSASDDIPTTNP